MGVELKERDVTRQVRDFLEWRGWRPVRMQVAAFARPTDGAMVRVGEVGMADYLFVRYLPRTGAALALWVEFKRPKGGRVAAHQKAWHERERERGAEVWRVDDLDNFAARYEAAFGWLHGPKGVGQMSIFAGAGERP